jgi:hypothetical protein
MFTIISYPLNLEDLSLNLRRDAPNPHTANGCERVMVVSEGIALPAKKQNTITR